MSQTIGSMLGDFFNGLIAPIRVFFKWVTWVGVVIVGFFTALVKYTFDGLQILFDMMAGLPTITSNVQDAISSGDSLTGFSLFIVTINTFFPLDLVVAYISLILQLWVFVHVYRFVKSWIPTMS